MLPMTIRSPPNLGDYIPINEYQQQTPESFIGGKPILHFHSTGATASVPKSQKKGLSIFPDASPSNSEPVNGTEEAIQQTVDIFVTSETFVIFNAATESGLSIPYPSISIHARTGVKLPGSDTTAPAVWMQLEFADGGADDEDFDTIELTIVPSPSEDDTATVTTASKLFDAMAACSDLHPDPNDGEEEDDEGNYDRIVFEGSAEHENVEGFTGVLRGAVDGGLPPPLPGSGGWITAENVNEYFDADGNWIGPGAETAEEEEELGEGAGRTRGRDEVEGSGPNGHDSGEGDDGDAKRVRTE